MLSARSARTAGVIPGGGSSSSLGKRIASLVRSRYRTPTGLGMRMMSTTFLWIAIAWSISVA